MAYHLIFKCLIICGLMALYPYFKAFNGRYGNIYLSVTLSTREIYTPRDSLNHLKATLHGHKIWILKKLNDLMMALTINSMIHKQEEAIQKRLNEG